MDLSLIKQTLESFNNKGQSKEKTDYTKIFWKPKVGKHQIRIVPSKFNKSTPFREVYFHYGYTKGPILALTNWGEADPIAEAAQKLRKSDNPDHWQMAKKITPKMRVFAPVIVRGEEGSGVRLWEFGKEIYMQLLGIADDEDYGDYTDINEGRDFTVEAIMGDIGGRQGLKSSIRIKPKTTPLSTSKLDVEAWLEEQPDILEVQSAYKMTFDKMKETLQNFLNPEDEVEEADEVGGIEGENVEDDLPWGNDGKDKILKPQPGGKKTKADKFEALFEEDQD